MAHISSEIQGVYPKDESVGSETPIRPPSCDYTLTGDSVLKYMTQDDAFQALYAESVIKRPCYTFSVFKPDELNDFLSLTFPQKQEYIWKYQLKSIWWYESGTSTVIKEELLRKVVLGQKAPFSIFFF